MLRLLTAMTWRWRKTGVAKPLVSMLHGAEMNATSGF